MTLQQYIQNTSFCLRPTNPYCKAQTFKGLMFLQSFNSYCQSLRECISFEKVFLNEGRGSNKPKNTKLRLNSPMTSLGGTHELHFTSHCQIQIVLSRVLDVPVDVDIHNKCYFNVNIGQKLTKPCSYNEHNLLQRRNGAYKIRNVITST